MCVIYLFSGIGKIKGEAWWGGDALLMALVNKEYQSLDGTWLIHYRPLAALLTHLTVVLEASYCVLVWPRLTRPIALAIAVGMHAGIGLFLGMWTFGLAMIIGNMAFVSPWLVRQVLDRRGQPPDAASEACRSRSPARCQHSSETSASPAETPPPSHPPARS